MNTTLYVAGIVVLLGLFVLVGHKATPPVKLRKDFEVVRSWTDKQKNEFRSALKWDFIFIPIYVSLTALICLFVGYYADRVSLITLQHTRLVVSLLLVGAIVDITENIALCQILNNHFESPWPQIARWFWILKFVFPGVVNLYWLVLAAGLYLRSGN